MSQQWNITGTDEACEFSKESSQPVIAIADEVIGAWREMESNEGMGAAIRSFVDTYEGEWDKLYVTIYERGEEESHLTVYPESGILNNPADDPDPEH